MRYITLLYLGLAYMFAVLIFVPAWRPEAKILNVVALISVIVVGVLLIRKTLRR